MSWVSFTALFFATWWVVLFAVLPLASAHRMTIMT